MSTEPEQDRSRGGPRASTTPGPRRWGQRAPALLGIGALALALLALVLAPDGGAQVPAEPVLEGRVLRAGDPLDGETVVLHRVAPDESGSVDSVRSGPDGAFRFELPSVPRQGGGPVYFASVRYRDVLYFGSAINRAAQLDTLYRVAVYDTTVVEGGGASFPVTARNILLEEVEGGWRAVDLFQIRNEGPRTAVAGEEGAVWSYPLPPEASDFRVGQSDLAPDAVTFEDGSIRIGAPIPPGQRTYLVRYTLPEPSLTIPLPGRTGRFELLIREPAPQVGVEGAAAAQPVEIEPGSSYRRYTASDLRNHVVEVTEGGAGSGIQVAWIAVALALVLAGAGVYAVQKGETPEPAGADRPGAGASREEILLRIAELDEVFRSREAPTEAERERYRTERKRLKERLRGPG